MMKLATISRTAFAVALVSMCAAMAPSIAHATNTSDPCHGKKLLKFKNGEFRVVQFTDTQDDQNIEPRTVETMIKVVETYDPDLVVFSGDNITGGPLTNNDVKKAIDNVAKPLQERGIPFLMVFGNHDQDSYNGTTVTWTETEQYAHWRSYSCNVNLPTAKDVTGDSNMVRLVYGSDGDKAKPVFAIWGIDSGRYAPNPDEVAGQLINGNENGWDYIRQDQVEWYRHRSQHLENVYGKKIPGLMFFHIPLFEHATMWNTQFGTPWPNDPNGVANPVIPSFTSQDPSNPDYDRYQMLVDNKPGENERNECVCTGPFNSGLFSAVRERGDVKGIFVGHDHINSYYGNYHGVFLGYSANTGFGTYGLGGTDNHRLRGARLFTIQESNPETFDTEMVFAKDLGVCINADITTCPPAVPGQTLANTGTDEPVGAAPASLKVKNGTQAELEVKGDRAVGYARGK